MKVTAVSGNTLTLHRSTRRCRRLASRHPGGDPGTIAGPYAALRSCSRVQHARFWIGQVDGIPTLMMDPDGNDATVDWEPLAEGVEDLQLVKGIDAAADGLGAENAAAANGDEWQLQQFGRHRRSRRARCAPCGSTLVARTTSGLIGNLNSFNRPAAEDHAAAPVNSDNFRRSILKTMVEVRNMSVSAMRTPDPSAAARCSSR